MSFNNNNIIIIIIIIKIIVMLILYHYIAYRIESNIFSFGQGRAGRGARRGGALTRPLAGYRRKTVRIPELRLSSFVNGNNIYIYIYIYIYTHEIIHTYLYIPGASFFSLAGQGGAGYPGRSIRFKGVFRRAEPQWNSLCFYV